MVKYHLEMDTESPVWNSRFAEFRGHTKSSVFGDESLLAVRNLRYNRLALFFDISNLLPNNKSAMSFAKVFVVGFVFSLLSITSGEIYDRTLFIRSLPGFPGYRSDLYEVYMEPYLFSMGLKAVVQVRALGDDGSPVDGPRGELTLQQYFEGLRINGTIEGLSPGLHGFHVHEKGDLRQGCKSAAGHYNPYTMRHGAPNDLLRHVGDLGNIEAGEDGIAKVDKMDHYLTLTGVRGAIGRTLVVHEKADDFGRGQSDDSLTTGAAGNRVACGIVGFL
ncbi:superoxide dismutase [Cu-Zn]-like isoform X1 [Neodiprion pinetum]|uniref:superoxide dismutase [Cu-Zn]-like isoform X1 n=1 Tax=Neodiprion pinetum TaxID=441929 RepID=UPI001EDD1EA0|nr:superoxide dismutase [Cu-Zn]-like isoform X1 [Neodiprion pinetum]